MKNKEKSEIKRTVKFVGTCFIILVMILLVIIAGVFDEIMNSIKIKHKDNDFNENY